MFCSPRHLRVSNNCNRISSPIVVGDFYRLIRQYSESDVEAFLKLIDDTNPIHRNEPYAKSLGFPKHVVPGSLSGSVFSGIMGSHLPGPGSIFLSQSLRFVSPIYFKDTVRYEVTVERVFHTSGILVLRTNAFVGDTLVIEGKSTGKNESVRKVD